MIYTLNGVFTDVHGVSHTNPVFVLTSASKNDSVVFSDNSRGSNPQEVVNSSSVSCQFVYYTNQATMDQAETMPMQLTDPRTRNSYITFQVALDDPRSIAELCSNYLVTEILAS